MQPDRPPRPGVRQSPRSSGVAATFSSLQQSHPLSASTSVVSSSLDGGGGVPLFAVPTARPNFRPDQASPRLPRQPISQTHGPLFQSLRPRSMSHVNVILPPQRSALASITPITAGLTRSASVLFTGPAPSSSAPPFVPSSTRQPVGSVAIASTSNAALGAGKLRPGANYSVVPSSLPGPATTVSTTGTGTRRFPVKQPNPLKAMQEKRAATKRKLDEIVTGTDHPGWERKPEDMPLCPICMEVYKEAHVTKCGHTYCYDCICQSIDFKPCCPTCTSSISKEELVPNLVIGQIIAMQKGGSQEEKECEEEKDSVSRLLDMDICKFITTRSNGLNLSDVNLMLTLLERRKEILTAESKELQRQLLLEFLSQLHRIKQSQKAILDRQVELLERDIKMVKECNSTSEASKESNAVPQSTKITTLGTLHGFNTGVPNNDILSGSLAAKKKRIHKHFDELVKLYMDQRNAIFHDNSPPEDEDDSSSLITDDAYTVDTYASKDPLNEFSTVLSKISRYHSLKPLASFSYSADLLANSNIVSSIEFDKDNEFFAIAGVTRKIKLFEYATVLGSSVDIHCPNSELACGAKISCISWSGYYKNKLTSSDYDGSVTLWDTAVSSKICSLNEHERRVWSVDWSKGDPRLFASGSDDTKVKLWSLEQEKSVLTVESNANVCCVKFCPENAFHIAFGSADHCIHYYDFRNAKQPMGILEGHKKAVSYVKFASSMELVSASTDSNLKLWDLATFEEALSFRGHVNEKNFVGLATDGDYIACGSENNSVYVYYKKLPKPLFAYKFENYRSMLYPPTPDESSEFVSAVAWKKGSPILVAANSQGSIKVLEMQS